MVHKRLAGQLIGHIVDIEGKEFEKRVSVFIPLLAQCLLQRGREEPEDGSDDEMDVEGGGEALKDHLLFHSLVSLEKIFTVCGINGNGHLNALYCQIWGRFTIKYVSVLVYILHIWLHFYYHVHITHVHRLYISISLFLPSVLMYLM